MGNNVSESGRESQNNSSLVKVLTSNPEEYLVSINESLDNFDKVFVVATEVSGKNFDREKPSAKFMNKIPAGSIIVVKYSSVVDPISPKSRTSMRTETGYALIPKSYYLT